MGHLHFLGDQRSGGLGRHVVGDDEVPMLEVLVLETLYLHSFGYSLPYTWALKRADILIVWSCNRVASSWVQEKLSSGGHLISQLSTL